MVNWFPNGLPEGTRVIPSDSRFTTDKIALEFIKHYIENSDSGPEADCQLMLMDNHGSQCTPESITLANIRPYPLITFEALHAAFGCRRMPTIRTLA